MIERAFVLLLLSLSPLQPVRAASDDADLAKSAAFGSAVYKAEAKLEPTKRLLEANPAGLNQALHLACYFGEFETVRYLVERGAAVNEVNSSGGTPLLNALNIVHSPPLGLIGYLIEKGADVNASDKNGETPLSKAANLKAGSPEITKLLISKGAQVNHKPVAGRPAVSPLAMAISSEHEDTARILVEAGADVNVKEGNDPLLYDMSLRGHMEMARILLAHGADANAAAHDGSTPLQYALRDPETVRALLDHGANPNAATTFMGGMPPLEMIASIYMGTADKPELTETAKALLAHGANVNAVGKDGCTMLQAAVGSFKPSLAELFVRSGASADAKVGEHCAHPLELSAGRGPLELVRLLLEAGATEAAPPEYSVCADYQANFPPCPKEQILALLANPPAPVLKLAQIAKEMREAKAPASGAEAAPAAHKPAEPVSDADEPRYHAAERPHDLAVVVGIENYNDGLPSATFAERDARAVRKHLLALGYPERNIFLLTGAAATRSGLVKNLETRLPALAQPDSTVFFYYSGHGAPDTGTGKAYLLPVDGDPQFLKDTAYPLSQLYAALGKLPVKRVIVALDSCFSGAGGRSVIAKGTRPLVVKVDAGGALSDKIVSLTASAGTQTSGTIEAQGHGAFTYYLLRGLNGAAKGDDGAVTIQSLYDYLEPNVEDAARRENRDQAPQLLRADGDRTRRVVLR